MQWDTNSWKRIKSLKLGKYYVSHVNWANNGEKFVIAENNGRISIFRDIDDVVLTSKIFNDGKRHTENTGMIEALAWSPDARYLGIGYDGPLTLMEFNERNEVENIWEIQKKGGRRLLKPKLLQEPKLHKSSFSNKPKIATPRVPLPIDEDVDTKLILDDLINYFILHHVPIKEMPNEKGCVTKFVASVRDRHPDIGTEFTIPGLNRRVDIIIPNLDLAIEVKTIYRSDDNGESNYSTSKEKEGIGACLDYLHQFKRVMLLIFTDSTDYAIKANQELDRYKDHNINVRAIDWNLLL